MTATLEEATKAAEYTIEMGGGTFVSLDLRPSSAKSGYAVGLTQGTWRRCDAWVGEIAAAILSCEMAFPHTPYIGTWWVNEDLVHIDPVIILWSYQDAVALGVANAQKSIWDIAAGEEIAL